MTDQEAYPVCYRHPSRETYVRCTRCDRPICPDCMISAAVGVQCPECVRAGWRGVRQPRRRLRAAGFLARPDWLTVSIIAICVGVFVFQQFDSSIETKLAVNPLHIALQHEWWRLITAAFVHANIIHILFNMYALYLVGPQLEVAIGRTRYAAIYLLSAVAGTTLSYAIGPTLEYALGASGAVFGCFGALVVVGRRLRVDIRPIVGLIAINMAISFLPHIDWRAHMGGLAAGLALAAAYIYPPRRYRLPISVLASIGVLAVIVFVVIYRTNQLT